MIEDGPLSIGQASYQTGDMWHVALAAILCPQVRPFVFWAPQNEPRAEIDDWERSRRKAVEYVDFYGKLVAPERTMLAQVEGVCEVNATIRPRAPDGSFKPYDVKHATGTATGVYYVTLSTEIIKQTFENSNRNPVGIYESYRQACLSNLDTEPGPTIKRGIDDYVRALGDPAVLLWIRASPVHPELNMNSAHLAHITHILDELGYRWTCVGEPMTASNITPQTHPLVQFYRKLDELGCVTLVDNLRVEDKRYQVYLFDELRRKGCVSIGFRSGTLDGCSAFLGMPTFCLDDSSNGGAKRLRKLHGLMGDIFYVNEAVPSLDVDPLKTQLTAFLDSHAGACKI